MVLLSLRASKDGKVLRTTAKPVQDSTVIKEPIDAFVHRSSTVPISSWTLSTSTPMQATEDHSLNSPSTRSVT